jgi:hypothetical protein
MAIIVYYIIIPMKKLLLFLFLMGCFSCFVKARPVFSFFNELKSPQLVHFFSDSTIIPTLQKLQAEVRMGILDLTPERASIVRQLNQAGIPVVAWLLLPEEQGYWFHSGNGELAINRYKEIKKWSDENSLQWKGIGIDLEIDINDAKLLKSNPWKLVWRMFTRLYDTSPIEEGRKKYAELLAAMKADGFIVESYYVPFIKDEVSIHRTALQQITQFLDVSTEREIPMLYSSFMGQPDGILQVYGKDAHVRMVALGSTGGGFDPSMPSMSYDQLVHDLNVASKFAGEVHIFSLEGCVEKGYLTRLINYQFDPSIQINTIQVEKVQKMQKMARLFSTVLSYPTLFLAGILLILILVTGSVVFIIMFLIKFMRRTFSGKTH